LLSFLVFQEMNCLIVVSLLTARHYSRASSIDEVVASALAVSKWCVGGLIAFTSGPALAWFVLAALRTFCAMCL
jgi:hypothetical protein